MITNKFLALFSIGCCLLLSFPSQASDLFLLELESAQLRSRSPCSLSTIDLTNERAKCEGKMAVEVPAKRRYIEGDGIVVGTDNAEQTRLAVVSFWNSDQPRQYKKFHGKEFTVQGIEAVPDIFMDWNPFVEEKWTLVNRSTPLSLTSGWSCYEWGQKGGGKYFFGIYYHLEENKEK